MPTRSSSRSSSVPAQQLGSVCPRRVGAWADSVVAARQEGHWIRLAGTDVERAVVSELRHRDTENLGRLEAVLFLAHEPVTSRRLSQYANLADGTQARTLVRRLNERYDAAGRAFRVEQVAGGYQLLTRRGLAPWLRRLAHVPEETRLSSPALETLAVIAYRQPIPRADIEAIRGVNCGEMLRQLMERDLVRIHGRSDELGRPYLYSTTKRFLQIFGLMHLEELPRRVELRTSPVPSAPAGIGALAADVEPLKPSEQ